MRNLTNPAILTGLLVALTAAPADAEDLLKPYKSYTVTRDFPWRKLSAQPDDWYKSDEAKEIMNNVIAHQNKVGLWPKKHDTSKKPGGGHQGVRAGIGSYDDGATIPEMRFLARMVRVTGDEKAKQAFMKGMAGIFESQYPVGGWPHEYPLLPRESKAYYSRFITYNDNSMVNIFWFLRDVAQDKAFDFVDKETRAKAAKSLEKGIECTLKLQIRVKDKETGKEVLTAWCAQYDPDTLKPREARKFEHPGIWGWESFWILRFLMSIEKPSPEVVASIKAGCEWIERAKITNIEYNKRAGTAKKVEKARPLWARIYEIETGKPIFGDWDGSKHYDMNNLGHQRRTHFNWYHPTGTEVLAEYAQWKKKHGIK